MNTIKLILPVTAFAIILIIETLYPLFRNRRRRLLHDGRNIGIFIFNSIFLTFLIAPITVTILDTINTRQWGLTNALGVPQWVKVILLFMLFDAWMYLWHRMNHRIGFFWRFHRMHHSDPAMDASTALRFHLGELIMSSILRLGIFILLGMDILSLLLYETIMMPIIYLQHSNYFLPEKVDRFIRSVITTPWMHWVHHSHLQPETDSNYGTVFSWWDRLARSFKIRKDPTNIIYGLDEFQDQKWNTLFGMLKTPLV